MVQINKRVRKYNNNFNTKKTFKKKNMMEKLSFIQASQLSYFALL